MVGSARLSPGFRFHPTDVELVRFYLKRKVMGKKLPFHCITELDIYKHAPWDLPLKSVLRTGDLKWYFFCPREKKYAIGPRMKRAAEGGYWKSTGKDRPVLYDNDVAGMIRTLVFHLGKPPKGERTDWVMYEYRLEDKKLIDTGVSQDSYVLSVLFKKDGPGPKNGAQYGAPFKEEEWESDDEEDEVNDGIGAALWASASTPSTVLSIERTNSAVTSPVVPDGSCVVSQVSCPAEKENAYVVGPVGLYNTNASEGVAQALHGGLEDVFSAAPLAFQLNPQGEYCASGGTFQAQHSPQTVHVASEEHGEAVHTGFEPVAENDDILAMLDYFTEEAPFTLDQLNNTEMMNIPNQVGSVAAGPCLDGIDIYNNLEDVGSLASFDESQGLINGVDYTFTGGHLEMMDLDTPLNEGFFLRQDVDQFRGLQGGGSGMQNNNVHNSNRGCEDMVEELLNACWRQNG